MAEDESASRPGRLEVVGHSGTGAGRPPCSTNCRDAPRSPDPQWARPLTSWRRRAALRRESVTNTWRSIFSHLKYPKNAVDAIPIAQLLVVPLSPSRWELNQGGGFAFFGTSGWRKRCQPRNEKKPLHFLTTLPTPNDTTEIRSSLASLFPPPCGVTLLTVASISTSHGPINRRHAEPRADEWNHGFPAKRLHPGSPDAATTTTTTTSRTTRPIQRHHSSTAAATTAAITTRFSSRSNITAISNRFAPGSPSAPAHCPYR